jgi:hypothetical protein
MENSLQGTRCGILSFAIFIYDIKTDRMSQEVTPRKRPAQRFCLLHESHAEGWVIGIRATFVQRTGV